MRDVFHRNTWASTVTLTVRVFDSSITLLMHKTQEGFTVKNETQGWNECRESEGD